MYFYINVFHTCSCASLFGCSTVKNKPLTSNQTQTALLRSGITLEQCRIIVKELVLDPFSCKLLSNELEPYINKAREIFTKIPSGYGSKNKPEQNEKIIEKIAELIKSYPETTEKEIIDAFGPNKFKESP